MIPIDEALKIIRDSWPSNPGHLDDLKDRLRGPSPIPLVPFIGAGLSMPMGFPGWGAFLTTLAKECGKSAEVAAQLAAGQYEEAAATVETGLGGPTILNRRLAHIFGKRPSEACELKGAIQALPEFAAGPVVTTNFDRLLERAFREAGTPFEHVAWGSQVDSITRAIKDNKPFLLKIHGDAEESIGRVLTKSEYDKHYKSRSAKSLRAQLGRVFQGRTLLFAGCSLGPDRTMDVLFEVLRQAAGNEHYAILEKPATDSDLFPKQQRLGQHGILPIWYPTGRHDLIEPLLRWIATLSSSQRVTQSELVLEQPSQRKTELRSELDLLIPYQRTTPLVGRENELASLQQWLKSASTNSVRVVTGGGGSGKTRLAVELIEWLNAAEPNQWNSGFLTHAEMERFSALQNLSQWKRRKPTLAILDYAAGSTDKLRVWLEQLSAAKDETAKFRLLLLEREASLDGGWLQSAISGGSGQTAVRALLDPPEPIRLEPVTEQLHRRQVLRTTIEAGAGFRKVPLPQLKEDQWFDRRITDPKWGDPLTLMMAGLTALDAGIAEAMSLARPNLALRLAERELNRIHKFSKDAPPKLMDHMAAYVTVSGGLSRENLRIAVKRESEETGRSHPKGWRDLSDEVAEALRGDGHTRPVEPDVVGEAMLLKVWGGEEATEGSRALVRAANARGRQVAASVMRTAQDFCVEPAPRSEPLVWLDALIAAGKDDLTLLRQIEAELPLQTLALRERAAEVETRLAAALEASPDAKFDAQEEKARILNNLGVRLDALGRREDALQANEKAVTLYRQLAALRPDAFLSNLAGALNNLGIRLNALGRREDALLATEEAVTTYRQLALLRPDPILPGLASALNNLGGMLNALGRREDALLATEEAVTTYRQLAAHRPDAFLPDLAMSLNNLGNRLDALGRREDALLATEEAVTTYRQLAARRPDAFLPDLATSLNNLGIRLNALGRREDALLTTDEAVTIRRQLAAHRPDAFLPDLAGALNNLGNRLDALGRREGALLATEEAVTIRRQLAANRPDAFLPDLAGALNNLGVRLDALGRREDALLTTEEAVTRYRQLAAHRPNTFLPDLAMSLNNLGNRLDALGRREDALLATEEAVTIYGQLAAHRPDAFLPDLATSLNNLGIKLNALGRREDALQATEEAVTIRRQLAAHRPDAFLPDLAMSLGAKGTILQEINAVEAANTFGEGIAHLKPLFLRLPRAFRSLMTVLVRGYVQACESSGTEPDQDLLADLLVPLTDESGE